MVEELAGAIFAPANEGNASETQPETNETMGKTMRKCAGYQKQCSAQIGERNAMGDAMNLNSVLRNLAALKQELQSDLEAIERVEALLRSDALKTYIRQGKDADAACLTRN